jgi:hypothetical protein
MPPPPAAARSGISPLMLLVAGLVILAVVVGGIFVLGVNKNSGPGSSPVTVASPHTSTSPGVPPSQVVPTFTPAPTTAAVGGITFDPATVDCSTPVDFTTTIALPSSVHSGDTLTLMFDGASEGTTTIEAGGSTTLQSDGTWLDVSTASAAEMQTDCANGGIGSSSGLAVLTPGVHTYKILDASGTLLAQGSYTVTGTLPVSSPTPAPTPTPGETPGSIKFTPSTLNCSTPVAWTTTINLPAWVPSDTALTEKLDGSTYATGSVDDSWTQNADGSWISTSTDTADDVSTVCAAGGVYEGTDILTVGKHLVQIFDDNGVLLSQGSYTVSK